MFKGRLVECAFEGFVCTASVDMQCDGVGNDMPGELQGTWLEDFGDDEVFGCIDLDGRESEVFMCTVSDNMQCDGDGNDMPVDSQGTWLEDFGDDEVFGCIDLDLSPRILAVRMLFEIKMPMYMRNDNDDDDDWRADGHEDEDFFEHHTSNMSSVSTCGHAL